MTTRVLIVDCCIHPEIYTPAAHWRALLGEVPSDVVHLPSGQAAPDVAAYSHIVLTGSEASIVEHAPWYEAEIALVRRADSLGKAMLGSCFGHQMLALALSGRDHVRRATAPELGWAAIDVLADDALLRGFPNPFWAFVSHFDEVVDPPAPWRVLARSAGCAVQVMRHGERPIWGVQAHPEIDPAEGHALLCGFADEEPARRALFAAAAAQPQRDDGVAGEMVRRFLEMNLY
jgi:GMP synthase-like glutamine amidotransferase